jgi:membrane carboxypeptidase/penicillin-binding protein PbpC
VVGVWVGNPDGSPMRDVSGVDGAAPVWRDVMIAGLKHRDERWFEEPAGIERVEVCLPSGLLPTLECQRRRLELFAAGTAPRSNDDYYRSVSDGVYAFVPLEAVPWARTAGVDLPPVAPYVVASSYSGDLAEPSPDAPGFSPGPATLRLVTPPDGLVLRLSRELPLADQALSIEALPSIAVRSVDVFVNGKLLRRLEGGPYRAVLPLEAGTFRIEARAIDQAGNELVSPASSVQVLPQ